MSQVEGPPSGTDCDPANAYRIWAIPGSVPAGSIAFPSIVSVTLVIGVMELAAKSAEVDPSRLLLTVPRGVTPLKKSSRMGNDPSNASGSASNPKMLRGCEKTRETEKVV
jgi:hypothetical protein